MQSLKYLMGAGSSEVFLSNYRLPKVLSRNLHGLDIAPLKCFRKIVLTSQTRGFHTTTRLTRTNEIQEDNEQPDPELDNVLNDAGHDQFARMLYSIPGTGHRIFLVQPRVKWGPNRQTATMVQYQMDEGVALVETLDNWKVVAKMVLATENLTKKQVFASGNAAKLQCAVGSNHGVSAAFVNVQKLSALQHAELEKLLNVPIFDRYNVVLQIFKDHAKSKISKLQVALAEIPHLRSMLHWAHRCGAEKIGSSDLRHIGGAGESYLEMRKQLLEERETKLKNALKKYRTHRQLIRQSRRKKDIALVAVVGYTNSGKTSLIKAMTGDRKMEPVDQLFATLDVTAHGGKLPNRMAVIYVDTVGFISDIPTTLIESFRSTLEDAAQADLIVHIRDISHPNTEGQRECVLETLKQLNLSDDRAENIIEIGNKIDLIPEMGSIQDQDQFLAVSVTKGTGLAELQNLITEKLIKATSSRKLLFRVPNGGNECRWLYREAAVSSAIPDEEDQQYLIMEVVIGKSALSKFCHYFGDMEMTMDAE